MSEKLQARDPLSLFNEAADKLADLAGNISTEAQKNITETERNSILDSLDEIAEQVVESYKAADSLKRVGSANTVETLEENIKQLVESESNLPNELKDYLSSRIAIKKAENFFPNNQSEIQAKVVRESLQKLEQSAEGLENQGWPGVRNRVNQLRQEIEAADFAENLLTSEDIERQSMSLPEQANSINWDELRQSYQAPLDFANLENERAIIKAAFDASDVEGIPEEPLDDNLRSSLEEVFKNINRATSLQTPDEIHDQVPLLKNLLRRIIHQDNINIVKQKTGSKDNKYLAPDENKIDDEVFGEVQMILGEINEDNIKFAENLGLQIAFTKEDKSEAISDFDRNKLIELRDRFKKSSFSFVRMYTQAEDVLSAETLSYLEKFYFEINKYIDWLNVLIDETAPQTSVATIDTDTIDEENKELLEGWTLYSALAEVKNLAGTPPTKLTVGSDFSAWGPKLQKAYRRYEILLGMASPKEQLFAKETLKLWDLGFRTMDGSSMGPVFEGMWDGINNYVNPDNIRKVEQNFGIEMDIWILRNEALKILIGVHPIFGKTYKYPDHPIEKNGKSFNQAAFESMFAELGFSSKEDYMANRPNMTEENIDLILDFMMTVNVVPGRLIDEAYSMLCIAGSSMGHNTDKLPDDVAGKDTTAVALNPLSSALYNILNNPHSSNHVMMNLGLMDKEIIIEAFKEIGWEEEEIQTRVMEFYYEVKMFYEAMLGEKEVQQIFGVIKLKPHTPLGDDYINKTAIFPSPFESLHQDSFYDYARYFKVEGSGFAWMLQKINEPLPNTLKSDEVIAKIVDFIKKGYGRAKLAKEDFPPEAALAMLKFYVSRVFRALDYGDKGAFYPKAVKGIEKRAYLPIIGDERIIKINELRAEIARRIGGGATTVKSYAAGVDSIEFRKEILRIFGAEEMEVPDGKEKSQEVKVSKFGQIPWYMLNTIHYKETQEYVEHMEHKLSMGTFGEGVRDIVNNMKAELSVQGHYHHLKPPYLIIEEGGDKKDEKH